jgi:glycosyltransferase involved in cell wall biosynthesis
MKISAIIIYGGIFDKELFEKAKKSVAWCDELILVNGINGSFDDWHNEGLKKAKGDWVLYIDSDEEITDSLREEIKSKINDLKIINSSFAIPRKNFIFNKEFKHSGQYPDYQKRLFKKDSLEKWIGEVHESPVYKGSLGHLKNPILHYKKMTISQMVDKTNIWSEIEAKLFLEAKHPKMNIFRFFTAGFREFWQRMIVQSAYLDGTEGIIYALYQVFSRLISYSKLWEMQLKKE